VPKGGVDRLCIGEYEPVPLVFVCTTLTAMRNAVSFV
jgi:hypothetical protein